MVGLDKNSAYSAACNAAYSDAIELFEQTIDGYRRFHILKAAIDLELFSWLMEFGPASPYHIAESMGLNERYIGPFLQALVDDGFLDQRGTKLALTEAAARLFAPGSPVKPPQLLARLSGPSSNWGRLPALMQSRGEQIHRGDDDSHDEPIYPGDYYHAERAVRDWPQFALSRRLLDLGGTQGALSIALCKALPSLQATILVAPGESESVRRQVADAGIAEQIQIVEGDLFSVEPGGNYDIVLAVHCLYAFPKRILVAMETIAASVRQHGLLVTQHWFEEGQEPQMQNCVRELDQGIRRLRRPLRHPEAFAERVTSAGFRWLLEPNLHGNKDGVQLRLAQRCDDCGSTAAAGCVVATAG
jgi:hypothetical protein